MPPPVSSGPTQPELDRLYRQLERMDRRLDALDQSDARTKTSMAQLVTRLEDNVGVIRATLEAIERKAAEPLELIHKAVEQSEARCKQYCDGLLQKNETNAALQVELATIRPGDSVDETAPLDPPATENPDEWTPQERNLRERPSCNRVLWGILAVASLPVQLLGGWYAYQRWLSGPSEVIGVVEPAFYPAFGATQSYP